MFILRNLCKQWRHLCIFVHNSIQNLSTIFTWDFSANVCVFLVIYSKDVVQIAGSRQSPEAPISGKHFSTLQNIRLGYVKIIGKQLQQSCVVFSVTLTVFLHIRLVFLKAAFVPESWHTQAKFLVFIVQVQFQYCDSYTLSACKAVKINQSFLSRIFHWHHWRICSKTDGVIWPMESRLCMKRNICINYSIFFKKKNNQQTILL